MDIAYNRHVEHASVKGTLAGFFAATAMCLLACDYGAQLDRPSRPSGPDQLLVGSRPGYTVRRLQSWPTRVDVRLDWGDGDTSDWDHALHIEDTAVLWRAWERPGSFAVRAQVQDSAGVCSEWSDPLVVSVESLPRPAVEVETRRDDGVVSANSALLPDSAHGFAYGWNAAGGVGVSTVSGDKFWYRSLYRFKAVDWDSGDVSFFVVCRLRRGSPGPINLYVVPDFDSIPDYTSRTNVTALFSRNAWLAPAASEEPRDGEWFRFIVPDSAMRAGRGANGWIAFLLAIDETGVAPGNFYELSSWEATYIDDYRPYLYW